MCSRDENLMEIRDDSREQFERLMGILREDFEAKIEKAEASDSDMEIYRGLNSHDRLKVTGQSIMCGIAHICKIELVSWLEDVLEMQNPGFKFRVDLQRGEAK